LWFWRFAIMCLDVSTVLFCVAFDMNGFRSAAATLARTRRGRYGNNDECEDQTQDSDQSRQVETLHHAEVLSVRFMSLTRRKFVFATTGHSRRSARTGRDGYDIAKRSGSHPRYMVLPCRKQESKAEETVRTLHFG